MKGKTSKMPDAPNQKGKKDKDPSVKTDYNAKGSQVESQAYAKKDAFKDGGKTKKHLDEAEDKKLIAEEMKKRADRPARKSGGRTGSSPFSSAAHGTPAKGRTV